MTTFEEYKSRISIIQVAEDLGYKFDKSKGRVTPTYKLFDDKGNKVDEIIIKNPLNSSTQHYYDRTHKGGDLICFIKNNINKFPQFQHKNEFVRLNMILSHYANIPYTPKIESLEKIFSTKEEFDKNRYTEIKPEITDLSFLTKERNISLNTIKDFLPFIRLVKDNESKNNYTNIAFPYSIAGDTVVTNYELRNFAFKGMAAGGDKTNSVWIATKSDSPYLVKELYFGESAIDLMSFYELNGKIKLENSAFISVGGYVSQNQILNTLKTFPQANINTCFDNDVNGNLYDIITYAISINKDLKITKGEKEYIFKWDNKSITLNKKEVGLNKFRDVSGIKEKFGMVHKPNKGNDWNDILLAKKSTNQRYEL